MPKIKSWSLLDNSEYDERDFPKIWKHDDEEHVRLVIKKELKPTRNEYDVYLIRMDGAETVMIEENVRTLKRAKKEATIWMKDNKTPPEELL